MLSLVLLQTLLLVFKVLEWSLIEASTIAGSNLLLSVRTTSTTPLGKPCVFRCNVVLLICMQHLDHIFLVHHKVVPIVVLVSHLCVNVFYNSLISILQHLPMIVLLELCQNLLGKAYFLCNQIIVVTVMHQSVHLYLQCLSLDSSLTCWSLLAVKIWRMKTGLLLLNLSFVFECTYCCWVFVCCIVEEILSYNTIYIEEKYG